MEKIFIQTKQKKEIIDLTDGINDTLADMDAVDGLCHLFLAHTTSAITTADLDPGTDLDMLDAFDAIVPKLNYRHEHNPAHVPDHIMSSIIGASLIVLVDGGLLMLGTWQRVILVEFSGPRKREILVNFIPKI